MDTFKFSITASGSQPIPCKGNFIRYKSVTNGAVASTIRVKTGNGDSLVMDPNDKAVLPRVFEKIEITNEDASETIAGLLIVGEGDFDSAQVTGSVAVTGVAKASTLTNESAATVGVAAATVLTASAAREYVRFRARSTNTDSIQIGAASVTVNATVSLNPGEEWEVPRTIAPCLFAAISASASQMLDILSGA